MLTPASICSAHGSLLLRTVPILNHYFYGRVHHSWLPETFNPLDTNPKSSNPYLIYGDLGLKRICETASVTFFYPLVYRVPIDGIGPARRTVAGSGTVGSREILVTDLHEHDFDVLFADDRSDADLARWVVDEQSGTERTSPADALRALERRLPS